MFTPILALPVNYQFDNMFELKSVDLTILIDQIYENILLDRED